MSRSTQLTAHRFHKMRNSFAREVAKSPAVCQLQITDVTQTTAFDAFTGDSDREIFTYDIKCLYEREFSKNTREKYGLSEKVTGIVYLAPEALQTATGTETLDKRTLKIMLAGILYGVDTVINKAPFYGTCVAIEIRLTDPVHQ